MYKKTHQFLNMTVDLPNPALDKKQLFVKKRCGGELKKKIGDTHSNISSQGGERKEGQNAPIQYKLIRL